MSSVYYRRRLVVNLDFPINMAQPPRHTSLFSAGMVGDVDEALQPDATYRDARNLRLLYNTAPDDPSLTPQEKATKGKSLSLELIPGTTLATMLPDGYRVLGKGVYTPLGLIVWLTNGLNAEIGRIQRFPWRYETLYNDRLDPNGDRLSLHLGDRLQARVVTENAHSCRVYWVDNYHGLRVLNLWLAFDSAGQAYHAVGAYPKFLSVHQMDAQPSLTLARMAFESRIDGSLLSGAYQLSYRYRAKDGHPSPWAPLTLPVWVTDQPLPLVESAPNHHVRYFGAAGAQTSEGLRFSLTGLDTRWDEVEVALLYHSANLGVERARIVKIVQTTANLTVDIAQFTGTAVPIESFKMAFQTLPRVGTFGIANNMLYPGNVTQQEPLTINADKFRADFTSFDFCADTTNEPKFVERENLANPSRKDGDKLTNSPRQRKTLSRIKYTSKTGFPQFEYNTVADDYINNKGQLVQMLFRGYRRGETYGFGAVCRDDKGNKYYVQALGEITMPTLDKFSTSRFDPISNQWLLRSLGVVLNGIRIPYNVAYYPDGKRRLSSIEIVRTEPSGRIGFQGVILPCTTNADPNNDDLIEEDRNLKKIEPSISWNNAFNLEYAANAGGSGHLSTHMSAIQQGENVADIHPAFALNKAYWATIHAPDVLIKGVLPENSPAHRLELIGAAHKSTVSNEIRLAMAKPTDPPDASLMFYTKNYKVNAQLLALGDSHGRPVIGSKSRVRTWFLHNQMNNEKLYENIDPDDPKAKFNPNQNLYPDVGYDRINGTTQPTYRPSNGTPNWADSVLEPNSIVCKTQDWEIVDVIENKSSYVSVNLVNFVGPPTLTTPPDEWVYQPTGYVLPITDYVLSDLPTELDAAGNVAYFVINGAEVYGGDTYVNLFDFAQLYPRWEINCNRRAGYTADYGVGRIVPIESQFNIPMRAGRSLANNAFFPQAAACDNEVPHTTGGISWLQVEDWNMAAVMNPKETIALHNPLPHGIIPVADRIYSIYYSELKTYGEREDSFRKQLASNYYDLEGTKGPIMLLETLLGGLYCWQTDDYGRVRTFDRGLIPSSVGELTTGSGKALDGIEYSKQGFGLQQFSAFTADEGRAYWVDVRRKTLCRFSQAGKDELSERERAHDLFHVLLPSDASRLKKIELTLSPDDKELWVSWDVAATSTQAAIHGTLVYTEALDLLSGWSDLVGDKYLLFGTTLLATNPAKRNQVDECGVGLPGQFFGVTYPAYVTWVVNPFPKQPKKFDNMYLTVNEQGRDALVGLRMRTATDLQELNLIDGVDSGVEYRRGRLLMDLLEPIDENAEDSRPRLWGHTLRLELLINPLRLPPFGRLTLMAADTLYRPIYRQ